jgi:purine-cytosine permease-like protein
MTRAAGPKSTIANGPALRFGRHRVALPASRIFRVVLGVALCVGGFLAFLPVLGIWMLPLGILVLSVDLPPVRRARRRFDVYWGRSETGHRVRRWFRRIMKKIRRK